MTEERRLEKDIKENGKMKIGNGKRKRGEIKKEGTVKRIVQ
jgi:hypothetical protein